MSDDSCSPRRVDRRSVLLGAGATLAVGGSVVTVAACTTVAPTMSNAEVDPTGARVAIGDVPVGGGTILSNATFVVTQPEAGTFKAFTKICTHQQCPVTLVRDGAIVCGCHGSEFSITDGSVLQGPATKPLAEYPTSVKNDEVVISG